MEKYFSGIITLRIFLVIIYFTCTFLVAYFIGYSSDQFKLLLLLGVNQVLVAFILYIRSNLSGLHLFVKDSLISVLDRLLLIIICSVLLWGGLFSTPFQIEWFIYAQTASYFFTLCVCLLFLSRETTYLSLTWNLNFALVILKRSAPYAFLILLMTI